MEHKIIFAAIVMLFLTIFVSSLKAQDIEVPDVLKDSLPFKAEIPNFGPKGVFALLR